VTKPFTPDEIVKAVDRAMDRPRAGWVPPGTFKNLADAIRDSAPSPASFEHRSPQAVAETVTKAIGVKKAMLPVINMLILGALAGAYIGFGAALATLVSHDAASKVGVGLAQVFTGAVFSVGLMLVVIAGAELFTGNNLMIASVLGKEYGMGRMLGRWGWVYLANLAGSVALAYIMYESGLWKTASGAVGARAIAIASAKVNLPFWEAFFRGIGCNWLVCLAVWMALSAKEVAGKVLSIFFPIMAFVALGYEHCVANMYFIPMGMFLKGEVGLPLPVGMDLSALNWWGFLISNLVPVTLGNIVGGSIFVGSAYWWVYVREKGGN